MEKREETAVWVYSEDLGRFAVKDGDELILTPEEFIDGLYQGDQDDQDEDD